MNEQLEMDFFFWLGGDGEASPVSEEEFLNQQNRIRLDRDNFLNVRLSSDPTGLDTARDGIDVV